LLVLDAVGAVLGDCAAAANATDAATNPAIDSFNFDS
jgi:hypothetical protein